MMDIIFGPRVAEDLFWFHHYFADRADEAVARYFKTLDMIAEMPAIGRPVPDQDDRESAVPRIPFSLVYRIGVDEVEVLRTWDQQAARPATS